MENENHSKNRGVIKIIKIFFKILYQILIIACMLLILVIVLQKVSNSEKSIAGYRIFRVITGSMEPEYQIGEVVICKDTPADEIKVGDDIVYKGNNGEYSGKIIMHEVVGIDKEENGNLNFHAKGLFTSSIEDSEIKENQIYGVVKSKSRILTILYDLATNIYTAFAIIIILILNVFVSFKFSDKDSNKQLCEAKNLASEEETENDTDNENTDNTDNEDINNGNTDHENTDKEGIDNENSEDDNKNLKD